MMAVRFEKTGSLVLVVAVVVLLMGVRSIEGCGGNVAAMSGFIKSPNFPNNYTNGLDCIYVITAPSNHRVTLTFTHFDLEAHEACSLDFVEIRDGDSQSSPLLGRVCNNSIPSPKRTFSNHMWIKFASDGSGTRTGFNATFSSDADRFPFLLISSLVNGSATGGSIFRMDVETRSNFPIPMASPPHKPVAVDYDPVRKTVYWTEVGTRFRGIRASSLNGSQTTIVKSLGVGTIPNWLAVDPLSRLIFYTDATTSVIAMMTMSTFAHKTIINSSVDEPLAIVLDTTNGVMFWTNMGTKTIERANYDGSDRRTLHTIVLTLTPNTLALDVPNNRLYWVDAGTGQVEMSDLEGNGRTTLLSESSAKPVTLGLAVLQDSLYITSWGGDGVNSSLVIRLDLEGSGNATVYWSIDGKGLIGIHAYSPQLHPENNVNGCGDDNGGCAVICIPLPSNKRKCMCPDGRSLTSDHRTCVDDAITTTTATSTTIMASTTPTLPTFSVFVSTPDRRPFDTKGHREMTLTCDLDLAVEVTSYEWSVSCLRQTGNKCVFTPQPVQDDGKPVTCTVTSSDGRTAIGTLEIELNYPPQEAPTINGHSKDRVYQEGDRLTMTCSVHGGKPLVTSVLFFCSRHPDTSPDVPTTTVVHSILIIDPLTVEDDGKRCFCVAVWKIKDWYELSDTTVLRVNGSQQVNERSAPAPESPGTFSSQIYKFVIVGVSAVTLTIVITLIIGIVVRRERRRKRYTRPPRPRNDIPQEAPYSVFGAARPPSRDNPPCIPNRAYHDNTTSSHYDEVEDNDLNSHYDSLDNIAAACLAVPADYLTPAASLQLACPEKTTENPASCSYDRQSSTSSYLHPICNPMD